MKQLILFMREIVLISIAFFGMIYCFTVPFQIMYKIIPTTPLTGSFLFVASWVLCFVLYCLLDEIRISYSQGQGIFRKLKQYQTY